jgi:hypothetical protein
MSTSPLSPEDIRAAAEVHRELGPEYSDAVVASFIDKVDREVAARVAAQLAAARSTVPAKPRSRRELLKGMAIGAAAAGMTIGAVVGLTGGSSPIVAKPAHARVWVFKAVDRPYVPGVKPAKPPMAPAKPAG